MAAKVKPAKRARCEFYCGASTMGKTPLMMQRLGAAPRVVVWDMKDQYPAEFGFERIRPADLFDRMKQGAGRLSVCSHDPRHFEAVCTLAHWWGRCAFVAEELADVTRPGKALLSWGLLLRRGAFRQVEVFAVSQRPTECDTTIFGSRTYTACFYLPRREDRAHMARELDTDRARLDALKQLEYIERTGAGIARRCKLAF